MEAAQINEYGGPSVVKVQETPKPMLTPGYVLLKAQASSLNPADTVLREGGIKDMVPMQFPTTLGGDIAGVVVEVGEGVTACKVGDEVYGQAFSFYGDSGAFAEYVAVAEGHIAAMPKSADFDIAGSLPLIGVSAIQAIETHIGLQPGQKILIHGGAGSVGALAIQLAKHIGAYVATTVSAKDVDFVRSLGADEIIDYTTQDFTKLLQDYDAVIDLVADDLSTTGEGIFKRSLQVLHPGGAIVSLVAYFGQAAIQDASDQDFKALYQLTEVNTAALNRLTALVDGGILRVRIAQTYALKDIQAAFTARETQNPGKIVIKLT